MLQKNRFSTLIYLLITLLQFPAYSQDRSSDLGIRLDSLSVTYPQFKQKIDVSVNNISLQEFLRSIASANELNITVERDLTQAISANFTKIRIIDVLYFVCKKYDLDFSISGGILNIFPFVHPKIVIPEKEIQLTYDAGADLFNYDFKNDSLIDIVKEFSRKTGKNLVIAPDLTGKLISGYLQNTGLESGLEQLAFANDLKINRIEENVFIVERKEKEIDSKNNRELENKAKRNLKGNASFIVRNDSVISLVADHKSIMTILNDVSGALNHDFFLFSDIKGEVTFSVNNLTYENFLSNLFNGTEYTFRKIDSVYLIGLRTVEGLRETKVLSMKYRTIDKIIDVIPAELKKGLEISPFPDLNSLIVTGSYPKIREMEVFLAQIDQVVPVVIIELMIVDVNSSKVVSTGISAGLGTEPVETKGTVFPSVDITLSTSSINNLIDGLNGFGSLNIGKVTPNFYLKLKALEEQGYLRIRSTPKLATINGHEAKMSIGRTEYYLETSNNVIGSQNPQNIITQQYKSVNADLSITINPMVSVDEQITLDVKVKQSSFTERITNTAPPGTITRDFQSLIRVRNEEMVILGGLEEITLNDSGSGVPFLSRIPVIKWLFSSRTHSKSKNKLTVFVKPTVLF